jgi:hypothetical protein
MTAQKYNQAFFLALAAKGKDAWNAWRRNPANKRVCVTFAGIDFSETPRDEINFSGFEFGDRADFSLCRWRGGKRTLTFEKLPDEIHANDFIDSNDFPAGSACFTSATFGFQATFTNTAFGEGVSFSRAVFGDLANFGGATFGHLAIFNNAAFGDFVSFYGAAFGDLTVFENAVFSGRSIFGGESGEEWAGEFELTAKEMRPDARKALEERHKEAWSDSGSGPDRFLSISFANSRFDREATISGRIFEEAADFTGARFYSPPDFDASTNIARIDFTGVYIGFGRPSEIHWTEDSRILIRLRRLRNIAEETKNHDLERDLYIEERKAERGVYRRRLLDRVKEAPRWQKPLMTWRLFTHWLWIGVMGIYWALADYGRSFMWPTIWLGLSVPFFYWRYSEVLAPLKHEAGPTNVEKYDHAVWMLAFGNAVPFVGPLTIDAEIKKFLFCPGFGHCLPIPPEGFQFWVVVQNLFSIILVFFIGLALRNYFRIK